MVFLHITSQNIRIKINTLAWLLSHFLKLICHRRVNLDDAQPHDGVYRFFSYQGCGKTAYDLVLTFIINWLVKLITTALLGCLFLNVVAPRGIVKSPMMTLQG